MSATDVKQVQNYIRHVDAAVEAASRSVEALCHRRFWNDIKTVTYEWPNFQRAYPWRIWFDASELADVTSLVPVVTTGGQVIPDSAIFWSGSSNYRPPHRYVELDRSQSYSFGNGPTPQRNVTITGVTGYWAQVKPGGTITASVNSSVTIVPVSDSSAVGVGDVMIVDAESMLVRDMTWSSASLTLTSGGTTAQSNDNVLTLNGSGVSAGEVVQVDAEWMLVLSAAGAVLTVERSWNGSVLTAHSASTPVLAQRSCTVSRGFGGTTAASHSSSAPVSVQLIPDLVHELALAEALVYIEQQSRSYGTQDGGPGLAKTPGAGLPGLRDQCYGAYGRQVRQRAV
jgi:hypothetical protein